jgi:integrase/recombinase XerD
MTELAASLESYLATRRKLGFKLDRAGALLADFVAYLDRRGAGSITTELALAWATAPHRADPSWWANRLSAVRGFARYLSTVDPATQAPPAGLLSARSKRARPYLYSTADITALMDNAGRCRSPLVAANYQTLIGLLAATGMRVGEAIGLDRDDLDLTCGLLLVRGKFGKTRQLPLHPSTVTALHAYSTVRDRISPRPATAAFFVSTAGTRLIYKNVHQRFHQLAAAAGLRPRSATCRPRPHDLRHTFAVNTLLGWYQAGVDVQARLPLLSAYLGHVDPGCTYWYLTATAELLALAAKRLPPLGPVR